MFDTVGPLPMHPLAIHAAVIGIPLTLLLALLFAFPRTRNWARWPMALAAVGAAGATFVAKESGEALQRNRGIRPGNPVGDLIAQHSALADQLALMMMVAAAIGVVAALASRRSARAGGSRRALANVVLPIAMVAVTALAMVWVVRVGDLGARAVWNPTGAETYTGTQ